MRGGLERWKRGASAEGVRQAMAYAFEGTCDSHFSAGAASAGGYAAGQERAVTRFSFDERQLQVDQLDAGALAAWVDGRDPLTGEARGRVLTSPDADLLLDGTINAPKSFSVAALLHPELAAEFEVLQDRLRERVIRSWASALNARRGAGGRIREELSRIEVVELKHRRSRALDPHVHRHLWLSVKVRGKDGKWSNVDSRVAMRFHTVVNAEGELAARTDPAWRAALASHGYTIDEDGEISELAHLVKPLSRRSNQIEANRAMLVAQWRDGNSGHEPTADVLRGIDRRAWALGRPNKPHNVDEGEWEQLICDEIAELARQPRLPRATARPRRDPSEPDVDLLASQAVVDADARSTGYGGRFSLFDLRAGAMRTVAASGVVADRALLQDLIDRVVVAAQSHVRDLLAPNAPRPDHVKAMMASDTWRLKHDIEQTIDALTHYGLRPAPSDVQAFAVHAAGQGVVLDEGQLAAAAAISGTDRLVSVSGPAGAGKTVMLKVARTVLEAQGRRVVVVAPTKKAATVAAREIGADATSVHALLFDHGWRWGPANSGAQRWTRLQPGQVDPLTGTTYDGPRHHSLGAGDRVVVDEAGMVDLKAAAALLTLLTETGAGLAMVGDHLQAAPVGHAGAMAAVTRRATAVVQLNTVHRFTDPDYADLTLQLRDPATPEEALRVAERLMEGGHVVRVDSQDAARDTMVDRYFAWADRRRRVAVVTASNDEADAINTAIQQRRIDRGELTRARIVVGADNQRILEGDVVQTRRNHTAMGVENRANWRVSKIASGVVRLVSATDPTVVRAISADYAAEYLRLAYASTVHGAQGETTDAAIVGPAVDAAGLYVGLTRGRTHNEAVVVAPTTRAATFRLAKSMRRGLPEVTIEESRVAAAEDLHRAAHEPLDGDAQNGSRASSDEPDWRERAATALLRLEARAATRDARRHGSAWEPLDDLDWKLASLRQSLAEHDDLRDRPAVQGKDDSSLSLVSERLEPRPSARVLQ